MTVENKDLRRLAHILEYCEKIREAAPADYETIVANYQPRDLCCFYLLQIGELVAGISDEFKQEHSSIPWKSIKGMRNIVAHHYGTIDASTVWEIVTTDIPQLAAFCKKVLNT